MVTLWPSDRVEIETTLAPEAIVAALSSRIEPRKRLRSSSAQAPFQGEIARDGFRITRLIHYRNAFLPVVTGRFRGGPDGTRVNIRLSLRPAVAALLGIWCGGLALAMVAALGGGQLPLVALPLGMLVTGWSLVSAGFWPEATKQRHMLIAMFKELEPSQHQGPGLSQSGLV
jgi:hypothetical protein